MPARFPAGRVLRLLAASLVVTGVLAGPGSAGASGSSCQNWTGVPPPNPGTANVLKGVAVVSACDAWAVGNDVSAGASQTLILHWNGTSWKRVPSPSPPGASLGAVAATSAGNAWAVGYRQGLRTLILHWNGTKWTQVSSPRPGLPGYLTGVSAKSTASAWAVGVYFPGTGVQ